MDTIGEQLKKARLKRGLTIEEIQKITKIQRRYLTAIEKNDFDAMPSEYYTKTFIRQYAEAVGINPRPLVRRFEKKPDDSYGHLATTTPVRGSRKEKYNKPETTVAKLERYIPVALLTLVVCAIVGTIIYAIRLDSAEGPIVPKPEKTTIIGSKEKPSEQSIDNESKEDEEIQNSEDKTTEEKKEKKKENIFTFESEIGNVVTFRGEKVSQPMKVDFKATDGAVWIGLQESGSGELFYQYTLQPGEELESVIPDGMTQVDIIVGAASYLDLKVNGTKIDFNQDVQTVGKKTVVILTEEDNT